MKGNRRTRTLIVIFLTVFLIALITIAGSVMDPESYAPKFADKNLGPSVSHLFGTDWMGRDMFCRTVKGLSVNIYIGLLASIFSSVIGLFLGTFAGVIGGKAMALFNWMVDLFMGIPHLILLILISILLGKGARGVAIGVILTHWCSLGRIVQAEILSLQESHFVHASYRFGHNVRWVAMHHIIPNVFPQFVVGLVLMFPHAIMHEAVGIILSESMQYLTTGMWWLAVFPGVCLLIIVVLFEALGKNLRLLLDPVNAQM